MSRLAQVEKVFFEALEKKAAAERAVYLDEACGSDAELRRQVERLLEAHAEAADFMARPAVERPGNDKIDPAPFPRGSRPDPNLTCDLVSSGAVSANGPSTSPASDPDSTCDLNQSGAVSTKGTSTSRASDFEATGDFNRDLAVTKEALGQHDDRTATLGRLPSTVPDPGAGPDSSQACWPRIPGYEILGKLGEGGMGVVYKARQQGLNRLVALKMIIGGSQVRDHHLARFRIEAEAVARLRHPNIVQIYDIGEVDGLPFVSLELLEGGDLKDQLAGTPQPGIRAALLVATLARAVHAAHEARIVHRDLKPSNVLLTADGVPKITDFGLAKRLESDDHQTQTGDVMGTPSYMAPEQALGRNKDIGPAADIYALGAILYDVLTGRPPLKGETVVETLRLVINTDPVPPSRLVPRLARDLETICLKCLHKDPQKRYSTAEELAKDLDRYREGKPIKARPTPLWEHGQKWAKRRPVAATVLSLGLVAFFGLFAGVIVYQHEARLQLEGQNAWVDKEQNHALVLLEEADKASNSDDLQNAQVELAKYLRDVKTEPRLQPVSLRVQAAAEVGGR